MDEIFDLTKCEVCKYREKCGGHYDGVALCCNCTHTDRDRDSEWCKNCNALGWADTCNFKCDLEGGY